MFQDLCTRNTHLLILILPEIRNPILLFPDFSFPGIVWEVAVTELSKTHECHVFTFAGFGDVPAVKTPWLPKIKE